MFKEPEDSMKRILFRNYFENRRNFYKENIKGIEMTNFFTVFNDEEFVSCGHIIILDYIRRSLLQDSHKVNKSILTDFAENVIFRTVDRLYDSKLEEKDYVIVTLSNFYNFLDENMNKDNYHTIEYKNTLIIGIKFFQDILITLMKVDEQFVNSHSLLNNYKHVLIVCSQ
jgi:hypothetical protein